MEKLDYWILPDFLDFLIIFGLPRNQDLSKKLIECIWMQILKISAQTNSWRPISGPKLQP